MALSGRLPLLLASCVFVALLSLAEAQTENLVKNPSFEENLYSWYCLEDVCKVDRLAEAYSGTYAAKVTNR